jgi:PKD repeat protein
METLTASVFTVFRAFAGIILFFLLPFSGIISAQTPFARTVGGAGSDQGYALVQLADSSFIVAGQTNSFGAGGQDVYVVRFNKAGKLIWTRTIGGTGNDYARSMVKADAGSVVIAGVTNSFGAGADDIYLIKVDSSGNIIWTKTFGGTGDDRAWKITAAADGGYAVAGISTSAPARGQDMLLLKVNSLGEKQWERLVDGNSAGNANYTDIGYAAAELKNGDFILFGTAAMPVSFTVELFLARFDASGTPLWTKIISQPHPNSNFNDYAKSVIATADGGFLIGAEAALPCENGWVECNSPGGINWHYYLSKFDAQGNIAWSGFFGGGTVAGVSADGSDYLREVIATSDGGYAICGHSYAFRKDFATNVQKGTEYFIVKVNASGVPVWSKVIGEETMESGQAMVEALGGGFVIAGFTSKASGPADDQLSIFSLDATGNACLPVRTGGKSMGSGGGLSSLGTTGTANLNAGSGGNTSTGGQETDLCAGSLLVSAETEKTCLGTCAGKVSLRVQGGAPPYTISWQPGNHSGPDVSGLCAGTYTAEITDQQLNTTTFAVTIGSTDTVLSVQPAGPLAFCEGGEQVLTAEPGHTGYTWNARPGGNTLTVTESGTYQATANSLQGCMLKSGPVVVTVNPLPVASFAYEQQQGYNVQFTDQSAHATGWNWFFPQNATSSQQNPQFEFPFDATYPVKLIVSNSCGSDTIELDVVVGKFNSTGAAGSLPLSIRCWQDAQTLHLEGEIHAKGNCTLNFRNLAGQLIETRALNLSGQPFEYQISVSMLPAGLYFIEFETAMARSVYRFMKN